MEGFPFRKIRATTLGFLNRIRPTVPCITNVLVARRSKSSVHKDSTGTSTNKVFAQVVLINFIIRKGETFVCSWCVISNKTYNCPLFIACLFSMIACDWPEYANCGGTAPTSTYKPPSSSQATWPPSTTTKWTTTQQPTTRPPMTQMPSTTYRPSGERCRSGAYT